MKRIVAIIIFIQIALCAAVAKSKKQSKAADTPATPPPVWMVEGKQAAYPSDEYLSSISSAKSAESAKENAASELSSFIKAQVATQKDATAQLFEQGGAVYLTVSVYIYIILAVLTNVIWRGVL